MSLYLLCSGCQDKLGPEVNDKFRVPNSQDTRLPPSYIFGSIYSVILSSLTIPSPFLSTKEQRLSSNLEEMENDVEEHTQQSTDDSPEREKSESAGNNYESETHLDSNTKWPLESR